MFGRQTLTAQYWTESLKVTSADIEHLFSVMLEQEKPLTGSELVQLFVERRVRQEEKMWRERLADGKLFQPRESYVVGQKLVFPALSFSLGEVVDTRAGSSPDYGAFTVIQVEFEDGVRREFASELAEEHVLNVDGDDQAADSLLEDVDINAICQQYSRDILPLLEAHLREVDDIAYAAGMWFLTSLLPEINEGHINLAEAVLDMHGGGPLATEDMIGVLDLPKEINPTLQGFALNYALYNDRRFDEVGAAGLVRWYLHRLEPEAVRETPERLVYEPIPYDRDVLSEDSLLLEAEIADEFSPLPVPTTSPEEVTLTLIYPHRRAGTLPLNALLSAMFPTAYEAERIQITLVDAETDEEYEGWVVRESRYVVGLDRFFRTHKLPIGAYVKISRTDDPSRFVVAYDGYRPRTEWIRLIVPKDGRVGYTNQKRSIGAAYDELMVLGADDLEAVDELWTLAKQRRRSLVDIIREMLPALARLTPQAAVHAKTLYSAVNVVRRCEPGPILAVLETQPEFESVGGHYWRYEKQG